MIRLESSREQSGSLDREKATHDSQKGGEDDGDEEMDERSW